MNTFKLFNNEKFNIITHYDLDGVGGPLLIKHCFKDQVNKVSPCGYGKITAVIEKNSCDNLIISDLSLTQEQVDSVNDNYKNVFWFDHHITSFDVKYPKHWKVFINTKACATKLIYLWLGHHNFDIESAKRFVSSVDSYDTWKHNDPAGIPLNNIFWELNFHKFSSAFKTFTWTKENWKRAKEIQKEKEEEIASYDSYEIENFIRVTFGNKYVSDISLFYSKEKHHIIFRNKKSLSVRSSFDLTDFYKQLNDLGYPGGGHHFAGGFQYSGDPMVFIELFYDYIKGKI